MPFSNRLLRIEATAEIQEIIPEIFARATNSAFKTGNTMRTLSRQ
jgi:hypothetical protein